MMRLTRQTDYAIRMLMYCAANEGQLSCIPDIAKAYSISKFFLFKISNPLREAGIIETIPGKNGGIRLAKPASMITVADVVSKTEENFSMADCFENTLNSCPLFNACRLNTTLKKALDAFWAVLEATTIADLQLPGNRSRLGITQNTPINKPIPKLAG